MTHRHTRRGFMGLAGAAGLAGVVSGPWPGIAPFAAAAPDTPDADLVVFNAKVYTMDPARAARRGVRGEGRPVRRGRQHRRHQGARRQSARRRSTRSR